MSETTKPARIQLSRRRGWKMPPNTVRVDRAGVSIGAQLVARRVR